MVPTDMVVLDTLPLTSSGKIDRRELARRKTREIRRGDSTEMPVGALEETIADLYKELLQYSPVGRNDNFFMLGGDSLKATELHMRLEASINRQVPNIIQIIETELHSTSR